MQRAPYPLLATVVVVLSVGSFGASCGDDGEVSEIGEVTRAEGGDNPVDNDIETLPQVDLSDLVQSEKNVWTRVVNSQLSPCGEPVSVARCVAEERSCRKCVPAARYVVRLVTDGFEETEIEELYELRYGSDSEVELDVAGAPTRGSPMAPITIVEFSDFECGHCGRAQPIIERVLAEFEGRVKLVFFQYPLDGHSHAMPAARAAIAARNQGKFWEMHDLLFENQQSLENEDLLEYARELSLDMDRFAADISSAETQTRIDTDRAIGRDVGVNSTPTLLINGRRFRESPRSLSAYIREELDQ